MDIIRDCQSHFNLKLPSELLTKRYAKFFIEIVYYEQCILCGFRFNSADAILLLLTFIYSVEFFSFLSVVRDE